MDLNTDKFFLITDDVVYNLFGKELLEYMNRKVSVKLIKLPSGEKHKNIKVFNDLMEDLFDNNVTKSSILISLGGGVVGNITGLAAALAFRGIRFFIYLQHLCLRLIAFLAENKGLILLW